MTAILQNQLNLGYLQAAARGQLEKLEEYLKKGADPEAVDAKGTVYFERLAVYFIEDRRTYPTKKFQSIFRFF